jgi:hypothetical protein
MAQSIDEIPGDVAETKKAILVQRRCIILAIVGSTPYNNKSLARILSNGFLSTVRSWLEDILSGSVGELVLYCRSAHSRRCRRHIVVYSNADSRNFFLVVVYAGAVDLLLHLLTNITKLPVTKSIVKESGMGKAIGSIEKHRLCAGTLNEAGIKERVKQIKETWNTSVKALKDTVSDRLNVRLCVKLIKKHSNNMLNLPGPA